MGGAADAWASSVGGGAGSSGGGAGSAWASSVGGGGVASSGVGRRLTGSPSGGGGFLGSLLGGGRDLLEGVGQGFYNVGRAAALDTADIIEHPLSPHHFSHLEHDVALPIARGYEQKYGGLAPGSWDPTSRQFWFGSHPGQAAHNIAKDPFGTALDVLALGAIPFSFGEMQRSAAARWLSGSVLRIPLQDVF